MVWNAGIALFPAPDYLLNGPVESVSVDQT